MTPRAQWFMENDPLRILRWPDALVEQHGYAADSEYVEWFWLPVLGPTAVWLWRRLAVARPGSPCGLEFMASAMGVRHTEGPHSPMVKTLLRLHYFDVVRPWTAGALGVRSHMGRLPPRRLHRLNPALAELEALFHRGQEEAMART